MRNFFIDPAVEEKALTHTIDAGIGQIEYSSNNLLLDQIMEALAARIEKDGALAVLQSLERRRY